MENDVVCGMDVNPSTAGARTEYRGRTYHFCSQNCKTKFDGNPTKYAK